MERRKIVDSNFLQSARLEEYLAGKNSHFAVLTDYAAMEAYKGDTLASIYRSMEILAKYPTQVIVLKDTQTICGLKPRLSHLQRRMIDAGQTRGFGVYCGHLKAAADGNKMIQDQLLQMGREADAQMQRILHDATKIIDVLGALAKTFTPNELKVLRNRQPFTYAMLDKIIRNAMELAAIFFRDHPRVVKVPNAHQLTSTYIFRFSLAAMLLAIRKIETGADAKVNPEKFRNDLVDLSFATYSTFFDGLLTEDKNLKELFLTLSTVLRFGFGLTSRSGDLGT